MANYELQLHAIMFLVAKSKNRTFHFPTHGQAGTGMQKYKP